MSQIGIASLLAVVMAAPAGEPAPVVQPQPAPAAEAAPVGQPQPAPTVAPVGQPAPVPTPAPVGQPAPVPAPAPASEAAAVPTVVLAPAPAVAPAPAIGPAPAPVDPGLVDARRSADGFVAAGAATLSLGGVSLLLVAWPSQALHQRSIERAESVRWVTEQDRHIDDARRHRSVMLVSAGIGAGLTAVGAVLLTTGLVRRARLRNPTYATLSVAPAVGGGHYGVGASLRF